MSFAKPGANPSFTLKAIQNYLKEQYGITISYHKADRVKERTLKVINSSHEEAHNSLLKCYQEIQRLNPESTMQFNINPMTN